jgi:integrase/recombinase XerD
MEGIVKINPSILLDSPKLKRTLPDILTPDEIEHIIAQIDFEKNPMCWRNRAIIEVMYSCGLRVSELTSLRISRLRLDDDYIRVIGKGDKERLIPIGSYAKKYLNLYLTKTRKDLPVKTGNEDILFLTRNGRGCSKVDVGNVLRDLVEKSGIQKEISPHSFRHAFATHMLAGGADIISIKDMLGHESVTTTEIYLQVSKEHLRKTLQVYHPAWKSNW